MTSTESPCFVRSTKEFISSGYPLNHKEYETKNNKSYVEETDLTVPMAFVGCLITIGLPVNLLALAVFSLKHKQSVHRIVIFTLTIYDTLLCGITLPFEIYDMYSQFNFQASEWVCKLFRTFNYCVVFNSGYIVLLMTVDRFRRVVSPLRPQMTTAIARICIFLLLTISAIMTTPNLFIRGILTVQLSGNLTGKDCTISDQYIHSNIPTIYNAILLFICITFILVLILLYSWIGHKIIIHNRYRKGFKTDSNSRHSCQSKSKQNDDEVIISVSLKIDQNDTENKTDNNATYLETNFYQTHSKRNKLAQEGNVFCKISMGSSTRNRKKDQSRKVGEHGYKITKIAIAISLLYILSYIPSLMENILQGVYGEDVLLLYVSSSTLRIFERTYAINHVLNPVIYVFIDRKFRDSCKDILKMIFQKFKC